MPAEISHDNTRLEPVYKAICDLLAAEICRAFPDAECQLWHAHPVWFFDVNPIAGYSKQKAGVRLMFWSGADLDEPGLSLLGGKFKDASVISNDPAEVKTTDLRRWWKKARVFQWD